MTRTTHGTEMVCAEAAGAVVCGATTRRRIRAALLTAFALLAAAPLPAGGDNEVTKNNAGDGYVQGVEVAARWRFAPQWTAFGSFAWMYGEANTFPTSAPVKTSEPLSRLMPPTGQVGLRWDAPDRSLWAEAACSFACDADKLSTRDQADTQRIPPGGTPGYVVFDLSGGWRINENLDVWAGLENITNADYRIHGSGVNEPGMNLKMGLRWRF